MYDLKKPFILLALLLVVVGITYVWSGTSGRPMTENVPEEKFVPGPPSAEVVEMLAKSRGFEALVSYTDRGFEPENVVINAGESIRFTNNSSHELWVAAAPQTGQSPYPGMSDCGGSSLDTCKVLEPRDFWEFTFTESGTWTFQNNLEKEETGSVRVQVQ